MKKDEVSKNWVWKSYGWISVLILFYLWSTILSELYSRSSGGHSGETGFILIFVAVIILIAVFTDREWSVFVRILWAIGAWLLQAFLSFPIGFLVASIYSNSDKPWLLDRAVTTLAVLPVIIWSMRRSRLFVKNSNNDCLKNKDL